MLAQVRCRAVIFVPPLVDRFECLRQCAETARYRRAFSLSSEQIPLGDLSQGFIEFSYLLTRRRKVADGNLPNVALALGGQSALTSGLTGAAGAANAGYGTGGNTR